MIAVRHLIDQSYRSLVALGGQGEDLLGLGD